MSRLSIRQLEIVRAIVRTGSLTAASAGLGISQPAASRLLRHAEDQLGFPLFERRTNGLRPTREAMALFPEIDRIFSDLDYVERAARDLKRLKSGRLRIAAIPSLALTLLADAVGRFHRAHPSVSVAVETALNFEVADLVRNRRVDLGLAYMPARADDLLLEDVLGVSVLAALPRGHALAGRLRVEAADLAGQSLVSFSRSLPIGEYIAAAFDAAGVEQPVAVEVGHSFLACALVRAGAGVALVDSLARTSGLFPDLVFVPFRPDIRIRAVLMAETDREPSLVASAFIRILRETAASAPASGPEGGDCAPSMSARGNPPATAPR